MSASTLLKPALHQSTGARAIVLRTRGSSHGPITRLIHVRVPAMLPAFFAAARMSVPAAILAVTVIEWLATGRGIGSLMALSGSLSDYDMLWGSVVAVALLSVLCHAAVGMLERRVLRVFAAEQAVT